MKSLKTNFIQSGSKSGSLQHKILVLRLRGGKVHVQYNPPNNLVIVGNSGELNYFDHKMDKVDSTTFDSTPLGTLQQVKRIYRKYKYSTQVKTRKL